MVSGKLGLSLICQSVDRICDLTEMQTTPSGWMSQFDFPSRNRQSLMQMISAVATAKPAKLQSSLAASVLWLRSATVSFHWPRRLIYPRLYTAQ